jgi:ribonucleoside-diphosphate reductase alpha chain
MDAFATSISMALQYGVPLETLVEKFAHVRFEPSGFTKNPQIPMAKSITDYIFRWMASKFLGAEYQERIGNQVDAAPPAVELPASMPKASVQVAQPESTSPKLAYKAQSDAPTCHFCGSIMVRNAACYKCTNCGSTSGCS